MKIPARVNAINAHRDLLTEEGARQVQLVRVNEKGEETGVPFTVTIKSYNNTFAGKPEFRVKKK